MICKDCGNKKDFLVMITDYKPLELWEIKDGVLNRYCQKDTGDIEVKIECASCGSENIDKEGFDIMVAMERPLIPLPENEWEERLGKIQKVIKDEEEVEKDENENNDLENTNKTKENEETEEKNNAE